MCAVELGIDFSLTYPQLMDLFPLCKGTNHQSAYTCEYGARRDLTDL